MARYDDEFKKNIGEHGTPVIYGTRPTQIRSTIDDDTAGEVTPIPLMGELLGILLGSAHVVVNESEDRKHIQFDLDQDVIDFIFPVEVPLSKIQHEVGETNTVVVIQPGVLDGDNHYQIIFEVEGAGTHYGCDFVVFPENAAQCIVSKLITINGEEETLYATMTSTGQVNITVPVVMQPESETTKIFVKRVI